MKINNYSKEQIILFFKRRGEAPILCAYIKNHKSPPGSIYPSGLLRQFQSAGLFPVLKAAKTARKNGKAAAMHFQTNRKK